jgi:hypothetical protein
MHIAVEEDFAETLPKVSATVCVERCDLRYFTRHLLDYQRCLTMVARGQDHPDRLKNPGPFFLFQTEDR